jgi:hypothetical protein
MLPLAEVVRPWHDFFALVGTASATLIGLLFVAASVGSGFFSLERQFAFRSFLSPTVVHFTCVLVACLIAISPLQSRMLFGDLIGADGLFGVVYAGVVWRRMVHHGISATIDLEDRIYYAALPAVGYTIMVAAGVAFIMRMELGCDVLAAAMGLLTLVGIRNAWDITAFTAVRRRDQ